MSVLPYHKRYHSDALSGMMPLTLDERGAYNTLLDLMYDRGGPLPDNERLLAGYMNCSVRKWRQVRESLIAKGKISIDRNGEIANSRARKEIENQSKTHRKLIEAGAKGGRVRAENEKKDNENSGTGQASLKAGSSHAQATRARPESRSHSNSVSKDTDAERVEIDPVKAMFDSGIALLGSTGTGEKAARSFIGRMRKIYGREEVAAAIDACIQQGDVSQPLEWIPACLAERERRREAALDDPFLSNLRRELEWEENAAAAGP